MIGLHMGYFCPIVMAMTITPSPTREIFLAKIEAFLAETSMTPRAFGLRAVGNHRFVWRVRNGLATLATIAKAESFMDAYRARCEAGAAANDQEAA